MLAANPVTLNPVAPVLHEYKRFPVPPLALMVAVPFDEPQVAWVLFRVNEMVVVLAIITVSVTGQPPLASVTVTM